MKSTPKLIVFHPSFYKPTTSTTSTHRFILLTFLTLFSFTFLVTLLKPPSTTTAQPPPSAATTTTTPPLSATITAALLQYAATNSTSMTPAELTAVAAAVRGCSGECNVLVFGFTHETLLWKSLNSGERRRTVFLDENQYAVESYERNFTDIEAYEVQYTTKVRQWRELIRYARAHRKSDCRPSQNLLFSDCKLGLNDLPNHLYSIDWDVIIVDGPRGYSPETPGRMSAIFTAAVMATTTTTAAARGGETQVFVHDYGREIERVYSDEFLCRRNLVAVVDDLAHFVVRKRAKIVDDDDDDVSVFEFCVGGESSSSSSS